VSWAKGIDLKTGRPIENDNIRYNKAPFVMRPSFMGGHNWNPMAFSPKTGLAYIPAQEVPFQYLLDTSWKHNPHGWNNGVNVQDTAPTGDRKQLEAIKKTLVGELIAWDPVRQKEVWRYNYPALPNGGVLATAGNLVFQGSGRGEFRAFDATTGKVLWAYQANNGIVAGPISYAVNGQQYVAVMVGYGGSLPLLLPTDNNPRPRPMGRLIVFKLNGTATVPADQPIANPPPNPPKEIALADTVQAGRRLFTVQCQMCHGAAAMSAGVLPDLRRSGAITDKDTFKSIVIDGILKDQGMVSFAKELSPEQAEQIRAYIGNQARILQKQQPSPGK